MPDRKQPGEKLAWRADDFNRVAAALEQLSGLTAAAPLSLSGRTLRDATPRGYWARVHGSTNPYTFTRLAWVAGAWIDAEPGGDAVAVESNGRGGLDGKVEWLIPCGPGEVCFQHVRVGGTGPPPNLIILVLGCNSLRLPGATVHVKQAGVTVATGTTDALGTATFTLPAGVYTATAEKPPRFVLATGGGAFSVPATGSVTRTYSLAVVDGYVCCPTCPDPYPTTVYLTDSAGTVALVYDASFGYWRGSRSHTRSGYIFTAYGCQPVSSVTAPVFYELRCPATTGGPFRLTQLWQVCNPNPGTPNTGAHFTNYSTGVNFASRLITGPIGCVLPLTATWPDDAAVPGGVAVVEDPPACEADFDVTVRDSCTLAAISGATVSLTLAGTPKDSGSTDSAGLAALTSDSAGAHSVQVVKAGYVTKTVAATGVCFETTTTTVDLVSNVATTLQATVTDCRGNPAAGVVVSAVQGGVTVGSGTTDGSGHVTFTVPAATAVTLTATKAKHDDKVWTTGTLTCFVANFTSSGNMVPAAGYACCSACTDPIPTALNLTDGSDGTVIPLTYSSGAAGWVGSRTVSTTARDGACANPTNRSVTFTFTMKCFGTGSFLQIAYKSCSTGSPQLVGDGLGGGSSLKTTNGAAFTCSPVATSYPVQFTSGEAGSLYYGTGVVTFTLTE